MEMEAVVKNMARDHGIKIKNAVDLRALAEQLDLARYDLNKVAITVLRKHVDVVRPEKKVEWYDDYWKRWSRKLTTEKVRFATVDAYLCLLVGSGMYDVTVHGDDEAKAKKKNMEKAKKTKK
ncbi:putative ribonuclease H-like domain-containing protein [Lupinus albus]|uniref:Putative ribonuclease H-like domain-containing protein n=1 Tax=Lupinus albus TaxID=3870 RepID=A0A6A4PMP3_LUPAL|nr:putative ribonuclease H-like domain-containing protein [Lupinus albus]